MFKNISFPFLIAPWQLGVFLEFNVTHSMADRQWARRISTAVVLGTCMSNKERAKMIETGIERNVTLSLDRDWAPSVY